MALDVFSYGNSYEHLGEITLGPDVAGSIGPEPDDPRIQEAADLIASEYFALPTQYYMCVDGRLATEGYFPAPLGYAHPQIAAGLGGTGIAAYYMESDKPMARSEVTAAVIEELRQDNYEIIFHGDDHVGEAGCKANVDTREALTHNALHIDEVTEQVLALNSLTGIKSYMRDVQVRDAIKRGGEAAANDRLWNIDGVEAVAYAKARGARYTVLPGPHRESGALLTTGTLAFDRDTFAKNHPNYPENQLFSFDLGAYRDTQVARGRLNGKSSESILASISNGTAFNVGVARHITREGLPIYIWGVRQERAARQQRAEQSHQIEVR